MVSARVAFAVPAGDDRVEAREVLAAMLDRRVRRMVRERLGAAYVAGAALERRRAAAMLHAGAELAPARAGEALAAMRDAIASLRRDAGFDAEFARARRWVLRASLAVSGESREWALGLARHALLGGDGGGGSAARIQRLAPEDVRRLLAEELGPEREIVVLRGPRAAVEKAFARAGVKGARIVDETD
jgi:predicted Zn-dependent peptidase